MTTRSRMRRASGSASKARGPHSLKGTSSPCLFVWPDLCRVPVGRHRFSGLTSVSPSRTACFQFYQAGFLSEPESLPERRGVMFRGRLLPVPGHDALFRAFSVLSVMGTQGLRQDGESQLLPRPPLSQKASAGTGTTKARKHGASPLCRKPPLPKRRPSETPPPENVLPLLLPAPSPFSGRNPPREGKSPSRPLRFRTH